MGHLKVLYLNKKIKNGQLVVAFLRYAKKTQGDLKDQFQKMGIDFQSNLYALWDFVDVC